LKDFNILSFFFLSLLVLTQHVSS